jgi:hypothetical protein
MERVSENHQRRMQYDRSSRIFLTCARFLSPLLMLSGSLSALYSQSGPVTAAAQSRVSLADSIRHPQGKEIHIFYIHGIGSDGPDDYDSLALRKSICDYLKDCTTPAGSAIGAWDYADQAEFQNDASVPPLQYMDEPVWKDKEEWRAATPYAIHYQLARSGGPSLYVDELNWWPLTFSLKCRQIVSSDAAFVAPNRARIGVCSRREPNLDVPSRFKSYDWISKDEAARLLKLPSKGARANRELKNGLMDWGFSDAVMALGPLRPYIQNALRQLILKSLADSPESKAAGPAGPPVDQEFIIVSHSLGSYLIFSALNVDPAHIDSAAAEGFGEKFQQILARTSLVYFFANQLRLLELAGLDGATDKSLATHLKAWGKARCDYLKSLPDSGQQCQPPRITALNDPSDLLTWTVPSLPTVEVKNVSVKNATHWLGLIENPTPAHNHYVRNRQVIEQMLKDGSDTMK